VLAVSIAAFQCLSRTSQSYQRCGRALPLALKPARFFKTVSACDIEGN
jgi:hypothetical protein